MSTRTWMTLLAGTLLLAGCTDGSAERGAEKASSSDSNRTPSNRIDVPAMVRSNLGITFTNVERRWVEDTVRVPGAFELQPLARNEYRMTLPGRVRLMVDQYQAVEPGDVLYRFSSPAWPELQHEIIVGEQEIESARAAIKVANTELEGARQRLAVARRRLDALAEAEFKQAGLEAEAAGIEASLPELEAKIGQVEARLRNAEGMRQHAIHRASTATGFTEDALSGHVDHDGESIPAWRAIDWIDVMATEPGVVEKLAVTNGSFVEPHSLVLSTVDPNRLRFRAMALQSDLPRLENLREARIVAPNARGFDPGDGVDAEVVIGLEADPGERTMTLVATPESRRSWMRPGVSAFLEVVVDSTNGPALAIPRVAVVKDGIVHVYFKRDPADPNKVIRMEADLGTTDGRWVAIESGLGPDDVVVVDGAYELKLASQQSGVVQEGGHFHADGTFHAGDH